jgi:uncharacterized protein involved in exopolysaccharide biosynthesis
VDPELRASDADRERVVADLQQHAAAGRLSLDEYAQRVDQTLAARTHGELAALTSDLPAAAAPDDTGPTPGSHQLAWAFLLSIVVLIVLGVVFTLAR